MYPGLSGQNQWGAQTIGAIEALVSALLPPKIWSLMESLRTPGVWAGLGVLLSILGMSLSPID